jgi:hypothetical protein
MEEDDQDEEDIFIPIPVGQAQLSDGAKRNDVSVPMDDDMSGADDEAERAIIETLLAEPARRRKLKIAGHVWRLADKYERTYPGPSDGDNGVGPLGSVDEKGLTETVLPMLAEERAVADFGHGCGTTVLAFSTRHITIGFEVVASRYEYSQRLYEHCLKKNCPLNPLRLGTHKHASPAFPVYAVFSQYSWTCPLWRHQLWRCATVVPACTLCEDNEAGLESL